MAYECGWSQDDFHGRNKKITAHMRPYNQIKELSRRIAIDIVYKADQDSLYSSLSRYVLDDKGEKVRKSLSQYFDDGYGDDTVFLFLIENDYVAEKIGGSETFIDSNLNVVSKHQEETDEERNARHDREEREKDDMAIRNGDVIVAVEMSASVWGREYHYCDGTSETYNWKDFRKSVAEQLEAGESECGAYRNTVLDGRVKWSFECIDDVIELYKRYALKHLDDKRFMETLVKDLPEFSLFKNADDFEAYEENWKNVSDYKKSLTWPTRIQL
jgi:hypothetical protein